MTTGIGLYLVGEGVSPERMRRGVSRSSNAPGAVHLTYADQPATGACRALCGYFPPPSSRFGRADNPDDSAGWTWTEGDISCGSCLRLIGQKFNDQLLIFATDDAIDARQVRVAAAMGDQSPAFRESVRARAAAEARGCRPMQDTGGGGYGNDASEMAGDAWYAAGCPSVGSLALAELKAGEHYPDCDLDEDNDESENGGRCTCYDEAD